MILVDPKDGADAEHKTSRELVRLITALGVPAQIQSLPYGDLCFEGKGPNGSTMSIGFERKTLSDMLNCVDDARLVAHQKLGMSHMYKLSYMILEALWRCDDQGLLMEGYRQGAAWGWCKFRGAPVMYSKLYRYLISLELAGMHVVHSQGIQSTARNIVEHYHYFQKDWDKHTAMLAMQKVTLPCIDGKPSLTRQWAACIDDVGEGLSSGADKVFDTALELAIATPEDWAQIKGISMDGAKKIVKQIERRSRK